MTTYQRRVSFDSLAPHTKHDVDDPPHIPPQYMSAAPKRAQLDLSFGFDIASHTDVEKAFSSYLHHADNSWGHEGKRRKIPKLPPAPKHSILKNNQSYLQCLSESEGNRDHNGTNDNVPIPRYVRADALPHRGGRNKKKSLVGISDEELLAMDRQYDRSSVKLENLKFDTEEFIPFQNLNSIDSKSSAKEKQQKMDQVDKILMANKKALRPSVINYRSFSSTYRHTGMPEYIKNHFKSNNLAPNEVNGSNTLTNNEIDDTPENYPTSLRDLMLYISGRTHTWTAIDWCIKNFLKDGDHLTITCQIPEKFSIDPSKLDNPSPSPSSEDSLDSLPSYENYPVDELFRSDDIKELSNRLSLYVMSMLESMKKIDLKISFTLELIREERVQDLVQKSILLYNPHVFLISSLVTTYLISTNNPKRLPFYLMNDLNVPTIVIPDKLIPEELVCPESETDSNKTPKITMNSPHVSDSLSELSHFIDSLNPNDGESFKLQVSTPNSGSRSRSNLNIFPRSRSDSNSAGTEDRANSPTDYLGPSIKFDNLPVPRSNHSRTSNGNSLANSRRGSSQSIYKVKSLLDSEPLEASKSNQSGFRDLKRLNSGESIKKTKSEPPQEKKNGFFAFFKRKK